MTIDESIAKTEKLYAVSYSERFGKRLRNLQIMKVMSKEMHTIQEYCSATNMPSASIYNDLADFGIAYTPSEVKIDPPTLCWKCENACTNGCSWSKQLIPVENWNAEETDISYIVKDCPLFKAESKEKIKLRNLCEKLDESLHEGKRYKYLFVGSKANEIINKANAKELIETNYNVEIELDERGKEWRFE